MANTPENYPPPPIARHASAPSSDFSPTMNYSAPNPSYMVPEFIPSVTKDEDDVIAQNERLISENYPPYGEENTTKLYVSQMDGFARSIFLSKVYSLLVVQLVVFTGVVCMNIFIPQLRTFNTRYIIVAIPIVILALLFYCITYCFRKLFPVNLMLLGIWTILVSWPIGMICSFYQIYAVLLTLALTLFVLVSLTTLVCVTKASLHWIAMGACLGIVVLGAGIIVTTVVAITVPWVPWWHFVFAVLGALFFMFFILFDTSIILQTHQYDEWIESAVALYVDTIGLFSNLLHLVGNR